MKKEKFVVSYSGGKDSALALHRVIKEGHIPAALLITYNTDAGRSWFHGIPPFLLEDLADALQIPVRKIPCGGGNDYTKSFISALKEEKEAGASFCVFGDIDIEDHRQWCADACVAAGIRLYHPLWQESREALVKECIREGFIAHITTLDTARLSEKHLGRVLSEEEIKEIAAEGADACGENGEYHTFVSDGPIFRRPISFSFGTPMKKGSYLSLPLEKTDKKQII